MSTEHFSQCFVHQVRHGVVAGSCFAVVFGHMCYVAEGEVKVGDLFSAQVDEENREIAG